MIDPTGITLVLDCHFDIDSIKAALSSVLGVAPDRVHLYQDTEPPILEGTDIPCYLHYFERGDFRILVSILFQDEQPDAASNVDFAAKVARLLNCRCLVEHPDLDPYLMDLVDHTGASATVGIDAERSSDFDEFWIDYEYTPGSR